MELDPEASSADGPSIALASVHYTDDGTGNYLVSVDVLYCLSFKADLQNVACRHANLPALTVIKIALASRNALDMRPRFALAFKG